MTEKDRPELAKILTGLAEIFQRDLKPTTYVMYFSALGDLTIEQISEAANKHARSGKFFPRPAELRELSTPKILASAGEAWAEVESYIKRHGTSPEHKLYVGLKNSSTGYGERPQLSPLLLKVIAMVGGVDRIANTPCEYRGILIKDFERNYNELAQRHHHQQLIGAPSLEEAKRLVGEVGERTGINFADE